MFNSSARFALVLMAGVVVLAITGAVVSGIQAHDRGADLARIEGTLSTTNLTLADTRGELARAQERTASLTQDVASARASADQARDEVAVSEGTIRSLRECALGMGEAASAILDEQYLLAQTHLSMVSDACEEGAAGSAVTAEDDSTDSASY